QPSHILGYLKLDITFAVDSDILQVSSDVFHAVEVLTQLDNGLTKRVGRGESRRRRAGPPDYPDIRHAEPDGWAYVGGGYAIVADRQVWIHDGGTDQQIIGRPLRGGILRVLLDALKTLADAAFARDRIL